MRGWADAGSMVWRKWWPRLRVPAALVFLGAVAVMLGLVAAEVRWREVAGAIRGYRTGTVLAAVGLAAAGHLLYTSYDLLARAYTAHGLPWTRTIAIAFTSYAFNLNLGPIIGAMGFRYRLYSRFGLGAGTITRVLGFSVVSNWLGYLFLAGLLFAAGLVELPGVWREGTMALRVLGIAMLLVVAGYLWWCARATRRCFELRGFEVVLPSPGVALLQLAASSASWLTMSAILFVLLPQQVPFATVLGVLLLGAIAGVATHIPAGLGVLEATFVLLLDHLAPVTELLAAVLTYRAAYYLAPLALALPAYGWLEVRARRARRRSAPGA
ncbi:MAG: lysylphosphatidylglycerol synthase domain-containing protein [Pseudomonadota bacterium]